MVKDSSPGGMNHPHVFKYPPPHDRADFREISVVPILRRLAIYLRNATITDDCAHCCCELNGRGL